MKMRDLLFPKRRVEGLMEDPDFGSSTIGAQRS